MIKPSPQTKHYNYLQREDLICISIVNVIYIIEYKIATI